MFENKNKRIEKIRETVKKISDYLLELKHLGKLIIISSHIKEDLNYLCDEIYYFNNGKVQQR